MFKLCRISILIVMLMNISSAEIKVAVEKNLTPYEDIMENGNDEEKKLATDFKKLVGVKDNIVQMNAEEIFTDARAIWSFNKRGLGNPNEIIIEIVKDEYKKQYNFKDMSTIQKEKINAEMKIKSDNLISKVSNFKVKLAYPSLKLKSKFYFEYKKNGCFDVWIGQFLEEDKEAETWRGGGKYYFTVKPIKFLDINIPEKTVMIDPYKKYNGQRINICLPMEEAEKIKDNSYKKGFINVYIDKVNIFAGGSIGIWSRADNYSIEDDNGTILHQGKF